MKRKKGMVGILFSLPSLIGVFVFFFIPSLMSLSYCFFERREGLKFIGIRVFQGLFQNDAFKLAVGNTLIMLGIAVPALVLGGLLIAVLLEGSFKKKKYLGALILIPMALPSSSILLLWRDLLGADGLIAHLLGLEIDLLQCKGAVAIMLLILLWKYMGYHVLIVMSSLLIMPKEYEEAAKLDGAGWYHILLRVKLPYLLPILFFSMVMGLMNAMKIYREIYLLQGDFPYEKLYLLQHFMNNYFMKLDLQKLSAAAFMLYIIIFMFIGLMAKWQQRILS